jgi:DNA-binding transcriptional ArsR family regulator
VPDSATSSESRAASTPETVEVDRRIVKALSHPLRTRILQVLSERVASPNEIAREIGEPLGNVSYHVRILLEHGCVELVRTEPRRGALEHFYRPLVRPMLGDAEWQALPAELRRDLTGRTLKELFDDARHAAKTGGFDGEHVHVIRTLLQLDDEGWQAMGDLIARTLDEAIRIQEDTVNRRAERGQPSGETAGEIGLLLFARP